MAEVFKAKSYGVEGFEKVIAIKRILPSMGEDRDFIKMFIDEAKIVGQLSHANICQIFELGRTDGAHFIAMEYIWGKDLLQLQNRLRKLKQQMPAAMACFLIAKVCEGLDYAHKKRDALGRPLEIVHRDCSPQNVLISYEGEVKIIDFGIAKAASRSSKTQAGVLKGKFGYMSPEQVRGLPLDRRSDLFSVGTILYECLTGDRLFVGETDFSTLEKVRNVDVPLPRSVNPSIPEAVERIIMKALAKDAADRYQWCSELVADLQRYLMSQEQVFTAKSLATWLKDAFNAELDKERQQLESFKKVGREGLIAGVPQAEAKLDVVEHLGVAGVSEDPTILGGPSFDDIIAEVAAASGGVASGAATAAASDDHGDEFVDEGPTVIFGEISEVAAVPDGPAEAAPAVVVSPSIRRPQTLDQRSASGRSTGNQPAPGPRPTPPLPQSRAEDPTVSPLAMLAVPVPSAQQQHAAMQAAAGAQAHQANNAGNRTLLGMSAPVLPLLPPPTGHGPAVDPALAFAGMPAGQLHGPGSAAAIPMPGFPAPDQFPLGSHPPHQGGASGGQYSSNGQPYPGAPYQGHGQPYQGQPYPGAPYQGQPYPGAPYQGQPYQGQPYQGAPGYPGGNPSYPGYPPGYGPPAGPAPIDANAKRRKKPSLAKDISIGIAIAAVVLGVFAVVKFVVLVDEGKSTAVAATEVTDKLDAALGAGSATAAVVMDAAAAIEVADGGAGGAALAIADGDAGVEAVGVDAGAEAVAVAVDAGAVGAVTTSDAGEAMVARADVKIDARTDARADDRRKPDPKKDDHSRTDARTDPKVDAKIDLDEPRPDIVTPKADPKLDKPKTDKPRTDPKLDKQVDPRPDPKADATVGYLTAYATPFAQVAVDGKATGKTTPITPMGKIALSPGIHKVTFSVGREKFTYTVKIEAGKTAKITKDLPVSSAAPADDN